MQEVTDPELLKQLNGEESPADGPKEVTDPELLQRLNSPEEEPPGAVGSFAREAARSVLPGVAGTLAGAAAGAAAGLRTGRLAPVAVPLFALGGGIAAGMGMRKAQDVVADEVAPDSMFGTKSAQADAEAHPVASFAGSLLGTGKPSFSSLGGTLRAVGTAEGRAGVSAVAKSLINKEARTALTSAAEAGDATASKALENFGHAVGGFAGAGSLAGMGIAQGEDPLTATAKGIAGLAVKPWVGPGGVFLNPMRPPKVSPTATRETPVSPEDDAPVETPATPEEQQLVDDAIAGKTRAVAATEQAANVAESTGTLPQTAQALRSQAKRVAAKPVISPDQQVAAEVVPEPTEPSGPTITEAARARAEKLGIDISQVPANPNNKVTTREVTAWSKKQSASTAEGQPPETATEGAAQENVVANEPKPTEPKEPFKSSDPTRVPDETLLAGVAQSKTKEEFVDWAKQNGYGETLRPVSGGQIGAAGYWSMNRSAVNPEAAGATVAPENLVSPKPEAPVVAPKSQVAPENVEPLVQPDARVTKEAQKLADELGIDVSLVPSNKQGKVSTREVRKWAEKNPPKAEEPVPEEEPPAPPKEEEPPAPEEELLVPEEEPPLAPETEDVNTDLEIFPMQGNREFPRIKVESVTNSGIGMGLSPFRKNRFETLDQAKRALDDYDRQQLNTFFDDVHDRLGVWQPDHAPGAHRATVTRQNALVNLPDGYAATSATRYAGATGLNWIKVIETIKTVKSGNTSHLFKQRVGGQASLLEVATNTKNFDYVNLRLREVGIKGAMLVEDPKTGDIRVYVLVKNPSQISTALQAVKNFAHNNNYEKIRTYRGDVETVTPDIESAANFLRETLGEYTRGGSGDRTGGPDRVRVARDLWGLARNVGIDAGPQPPEYVEPQKRGTSLLQYEKSLAEQKEAFEKIPAEKRARFAQLLTQAYDHLATALGFKHVQLKELGGLLQGREGNQVFEAYAKRLRELYSEEDLVPDLVQRPDKPDGRADYGVSYAEGSAFPAYRSSDAIRNDLLGVTLGKVFIDVAKRADGKSLSKSKTKSNLAKLEALDKQIEEIRSSTTRANKITKEQKAKLEELEADREKAENQIDPWTVDPKVFRRYVLGKLDNSVERFKTVKKNRAKAGLEVTEDTVLAGDEKEATSITENAADQSEGGTLGIDPETKKAAYEALRNSDNNFSATDRYAIGKKLAQSGALNPNEIRALTPEINQLVKTLDALDQSAQERNSAKKGNLGIEDRTAREEGELLADNYTLEELVARKHRRKDGQLRAARLYRPGEETPFGERAEPPKVVYDINARSYLEFLLNGEVGTEDAAQIRQLLKQANLDNIPLRVYDYLPRGEYGHYNPRTGEVAINRELIGAPESNVETGLHEVHHALLRYFLDPQNEANLNSRQRKLVRDLNRLYEWTTENAIKEGQFTREHLDSIRNLTGDLSLPTNEHKSAFFYSDLDEWASAMMSNNNFREYMKGLETRDVVTGKLRSAWEAFKDFVAKLFGMDRSIHRKSFDKIMELATDPEAGRLESEGLVAPDSLNYRRLFKFVDKIAKQNPSFRNPKTHLQHSREAEEILRRIEKSDDQIEGSEAYSQLLDFVREISGRTSQDWARMNGPAYEMFVKGLDKSGPVDSRGPFANPPFYVREARRLIDRLAPEARRRWKRWPESNQDYSYAGPMPGEILTRPGRTSLITPQQDADYMAAVRQGDMETAQRMVDEAARASGYTPNLWLGGAEGQNVIGSKRAGAIFATTSRQVAETYGKARRVAMRFRNPLKFDAGGRDDGAVMFEGNEFTSDDVADIAKERGHDGVIADNVVDVSDYAFLPQADQLLSKEQFTNKFLGSNYMAFNPEQIKSADPITYDNNGNVIPLSQRFNSDTADLRFRPNMGESPRFKEKVSTAKANDELPPEEKVTFRSQTVPQAEMTAEQWISNGGSFQDLVNRKAPISIPETFRAAAIMGGEARAARVRIERKANPDAIEIAAKREAADRERAISKLVARMMSEGGQLLGHGQHVDFEGRSITPDEAIRILLGGKTPEQLASGKIDLQRMLDGIGAIKSEAADIAMKVLGDDLRNAGAADPSGELHAKLRDTLAHPSTTFRDIVNMVAYMLPKGEGNQAKTRALAEKIHRLYSIAANTVAKTKLPELVQETYNGESIVPKSDQFLRKLNDFLKVGKYSEDDITVTLLESLGLSGYDADFVKGIRRDLDKMAIMPEGDMQNTAKNEILQKVRTKLINNILKAPKWDKQTLDNVRDMVAAAWQSGVLSGPPTGIVNLLASNASIVTESFMQAIGSAVKTGDVRYFGDVFGGFFSALLGNQSTGRGSAARSEAYAALMGKGTKYRNAILNEMPILENIDTTGASAVTKALAGHAKNLRWVGRVMSALDAVNMSMADEAMQRMAARFFLTEMKGHKASEVSDLMHKLFNPDEVTVSKARQQAEAEVLEFLGNKSAKEQARWADRRTLELLAQRREEVVPGIMDSGREAAERFTYNETAKGLLGKIVVGLTSQINQNVKEGRFVFSFMNTLVNIINQTLDYTPYGFLRAKNWSLGQKTLVANEKYRPRTYKEGSPEQAAQVARATLGTAFMLGLMYMAYKGREDELNGKTPYFTVTGPGPKDPYDRQQLQDTQDWRPNSVKIGNEWVRYMDLPIIGSALGFVGTALDTVRYKKSEQTEGEAFTTATLAAVTTILDKQLLQGANNFFTMFRGGNPGAQTYAAKRFTGGVVAGFTNPGLARWIRNTVDVDGQGNVDRLDQSTFQGWVASMLPFSIGYNTPALNTLGEPIKQPWYSATTYRFGEFNKLPEHPIITPLVRAGLMLPNPQPGTHFSYKTKDGAEVVTTLGKHPEVMRRYVELRGKNLKTLLTPDSIAGLQRMAAANKDDAQDYLDSKIGGAARKAAIRQIEQEIREGKLKV